MDTTTNSIENAENEGDDVVKDKLDKILRHHVYASIGVGLIPVPVIDFVGLTGVQLNMLRKIAKIYEVRLLKDAVKNIVFSLVGGALPVAASAPLAASGAKAIPLFGQTAGVVTMPIVAGATTYAIGKVFIQHFASGGTFLTFDPEKVKGYFAEMFNEGEKIVADIKKGKETTPDIKETTPDIKKGKETTPDIKEGEKVTANRRKDRKKAPIKKTSADTPAS